LRKRQYDFSRAVPYLRQWTRETKQRVQDNNVPIGERTDEAHSAPANMDLETNKAAVEVAPQAEQATDKGKEKEPEAVVEVQEKTEVAVEKDAVKEQEEERRVKVEQRLEFVETPLRAVEKKKVRLQFYDVW
jgi:hypothetical protein